MQKRDKDTLLPLNKKFILPGIEIITDGWKVYNNLEQEGYIHGIVNNSIDNDHPEINTQKVERVWKSLKNELKGKGRPEDDNMYIFPFIYFQKHHSRYFHTLSRLWEARIKASCLLFKP